MAIKTLTDNDFCEAARSLGCEPAAIKAVALVESAKGGFDKDGRIIIRFERHRFKKYTNGKYDKTHPSVSAPYRKGQPGGRNLFNTAFKLNPTAALKSTSWGRFQIMGDEHNRCGFDNVHDFVDFLKQGEPEQLYAFCEFVKDKNLAQHIQSRNWAKFAFGYNGSGYKANAYDTKMAKHYTTFSKQGFNCQEPQQTPELQAKPEPDTAPETKPEQAQTNTQTPADESLSLPSIETVQQQIPRITKARTWLGTLGLGGILSTTAAVFNGMEPWQIFALGLLTAVLLIGLVWLLVSYNKQIFALVKRVADINANPQMGHVELVSREEKE